MATATISKSKQNRTFSNAADIITVTGSDNKIYTKGGQDRITVVKGANNMIDSGTGSDLIVIEPKTGNGQKLYGSADKDTIIVNAGNKHMLSGGTGSDNYIINSKIAKSTRLSIDQTGYKKKDADILQLSKVNMADMSYSLNKGTLTVTHTGGGRITVSGWNKNPLSKIEFANHQPGPFNSQSVTGKQINKYLALASGNVINVTKKGTYKATKSKDLFRFSGFGWTAVVKGADKSDALDLTGYNPESLDEFDVERKSNDLCVTLVKEGKGSKTGRTATINIKNYFTSKNRLGKIAYYDHVDDDNHGFDKTTLCVLNLKFGENGTSGDDRIQAVKAGTLKGRAGNDMIFGSEGINKLYGDAGDDVIDGDDGNDKLYGGAGNDEIEGGDGNDKLYGGAGHDWLSDDDGKNELYGEAGNDVLEVSGDASHKLKGGTGSDSYVIDSVHSGVNITIDQNDFKKGDLDILYLDFVDKGSVNYSLENDALTIAQNYGGSITVTGWDVNPLSKIVFAGNTVVNGSDIF